MEFSVPDPFVDDQEQEETSEEVLTSRQALGVRNLLGQSMKLSVRFQPTEAQLIQAVTDTSLRKDQIIYLLAEAELRATKESDVVFDSVLTASAPRPGNVVSTSSSHLSNFAAPASSPPSLFNSISGQGDSSSSHSLNHYENDDDDDDEFCPGLGVALLAVQRDKAFSPEATRIMEAAWDYGLLADSSYYQALATLADTTSNMVSSWVSGKGESPPSEPPEYIEADTGLIPEPELHILEQAEALGVLTTDLFKFFGFLVRRSEGQIRAWRGNYRHRKKSGDPSFCPKSSKRKSVAGRTHSNNSSKKARRISTVPTTVNAEEMLELAFNSSFTDNESQRAFFAEIIGLPIEKVNAWITEREGRERGEPFDKVGIKGRLPYWVQTLLHIAYTQGKTDDNSVKHLENLFEITNSRVQSWFRAAKKNNEASQPNEPEYTNVKCICNQPFDSDKGMIDCSVCQEWSHWECIGAKNEAQAKSLSPWTCGKCKEKAAV